MTASVLSSAGLDVEVWDHGARLLGVFVDDRDGNRANVVLRHPTLHEYTEPGHAYFGATIGRYANRIANGRLQVGDQGFPGEVSVEVTYAVAATQLRIDTVAVTDADTVVGSTNHAYWNLAGGGTIADHHLWTSTAMGRCGLDCRTRSRGGS